MYDVNKLREYFPSTTVFKDPSVMLIFKAAKIEAFLRDWILKRRTGSDGAVDNIDALSDYVAAIIPPRSEKGRLEDEARTSGETRSFLAKVNVSFNSNSNYYSFEIPSIGFTHSHTIIEDYVWNRIKDELIGEAGGWGLIKLGYMPPEGGKKNGRFTLLGMYINDWALNSEYFTEIMHLLRATSETMKYCGMVEELIEVKAATGDTSGREKEAVFRLCTAYLKLFFPHADITLIHTTKLKQEFDKFSY